MLSHEVLSESKSARCNVLAVRCDEQASDALCQAKALVMAVWQGTGYATTEQVAEYYEVTRQAIQNLVDRNGEEFGEEVKKLTGKDLRELKLILSVSSNAASMLVWTARGMLRVGLMLTQSEVARRVRDVVLNVVEAAKPSPPEQTSGIDVMTGLGMIKQSLLECGIAPDLVQGVYLNGVARHCPAIASEVNEAHKLLAATTTSDVLLTPTSIGKKLGISAIAVNQILCQMGYQVRCLQARNGEPKYQATAQGSNYAANTIATGKVGDNTTYQHLKWKSEIVEIIRKYIQQ